MPDNGAMARPLPRLTPAEIERVIATAWDDRPPFNAVLTQHGLNPGQVVALLKLQLTPNAFKVWTARTKGVVLAGPPGAARAPAKAPPRVPARLRAGVTAHDPRFAPAEPNLPPRSAAVKPKPRSTAKSVPRAAAKAAATGPAKGAATAVPGAAAKSLRKSPRKAAPKPPRKRAR